ncbi:hypothetical protein PGT21_030992 [Puccinia graminis f. sp. tritici]|uniref:Probable alpha/beta-glucosidase agdC n=1 Tax=Puccinia graminis f. sp. tritici TaxID=56615 RepID=A0A5B0R503_PUCGR|nr:hypothetical protein PGT21_030992 [Puccinia graminis f. sp. tritici]KAA1120656.1 hypothetical protein PGTUg99_018218 [Puccinia graminis f. sp. tritici]
MILFSVAASFWWLLVVLSVSRAEKCPFYVLSELNKTVDGFDASLMLNGSPCQADDIASLKLIVNYDTDERLHVRIVDAGKKRYEVPDFLFPRPIHSTTVLPKSSTNTGLVFSYETAPFSFTVSRRSTREVLFSTISHPIIYRDKHIQIATQLSPNANIYGLGESTDTFRIKLDGNGTRRTMWARDAYGTQKGTNLYGTHPIYYDHRPNGTHGVFLLNSNGMDITLNKESIQYDVTGGVLDFYFLAGPSPVKVAEQYSALAGLPAMIPYWSLGFQQCRYGYSNYVEVAEVIANYSKAGIPLETMWTDIDYMYKRRTFTLDPDYFPLNRMQEIVKSLHKNNQRYVMMIDPAVAYQPGDKGTFDRGTEADVFMKEKDGKVFQGVVWAGVSVYPDWFHPNAEAFWINEIERFFDPTNGIDIDGIWIDMNEPANFALPCAYPCNNTNLLPGAQAIASGNPPARKNPPPPKDVPLPIGKLHGRRGMEDNTQYQIHNAAGELAKGTIRTDLVHHNGLTEYDVHNLYGTFMSWITRKAMLHRRSKVRPQVVTRSTFAGAGAYVAHWTGDNLSDWTHYLSSITEIMSFAALFQIPLVGADVCGFGSNTNEELCARWASLGAFYPFYRNHNELGMISQEFYRWESVARSARNAIKIRYSLLDYFYTHMRRQSLTGEPALKPLWFAYPQDTSTFGIDKQFFFGDAILISPVVEANSITVNAYFPESNYIEFSSRKIVGNSGNIDLKNIQIDQIPVHIKPGSILPIRQVANNQTLAMTTTEVRSKNFEILVLPNSSGSAKGSLYLDDGESLEPLAEETADLEFTYDQRVLHISGRLGSRLKDISISVGQWSFSNVPNIQKIKGLRVIDSPQLESGAQLLPVHVDAKTRSIYARGNWKLAPGMKIALVY